MAFFGGIVAIALGKFAFGGLGNNVFNPALVGRVVLQAAFPVSITTWFPALAENRFSEVSASTLTFPFMTPDTDVVSGATPLSAFKFEHVTTGTQELAFGLVSGSLGESSAVLILVCGTYLAIRKMMNWRIPVSILLTVFILSSILYGLDNQTYPSPLFMLLSGGLVLGAVFMASDMVASPITSAGIWIYGFAIGLLVVVIRIWGGQPEGVMYAILLGNAISPQIDHAIQPRVYGTSKRRRS
jgi:electron transport complex protein RnfD